jgi:predicted NBD/HSP70 family sugar kinase
MNTGDNGNATVRVLAAVRGRKLPVSKADLVRLTGLSLATVTEHVDNLLARDLLREEDTGASSGGRKPKLFGFNSEAGRIIAIDLESTHVNVAVLDFGRRILASASSDELDVGLGPDIVLDHVRKLVFQVLKEARAKPEQIRGLGMGLPGPVSFSAGLPSSLAIMPGWENYPVRAYWEKYFACPTLIDNNVYTMVLGESSLYDAEEPSDTIFVKIGNGIGAGIICNGLIYRGATEHAGEIGHTNIGHEQLCYCGNRGCLEAFAGGRAIAARAEVLAREGQSAVLAAMLDANKKLSLRDVVKAVEESDPAAVGLIRESGSAIGNVIAGLTNFFNPSHIIVGGGVSKVGDVFLAAIRQAIYQHSLPLSNRRVIIDHSVLGANAGLIGAAVLALDHVIQGSLSSGHDGVVKLSARGA